MSRLIIISNRLSSTVVLGKDHSVRLTAGQGGIASGLRSIYKQKDSLWVGWPGVFAKDQREKKNIKQMLANEQQHPVFLSRKEIDQFYHGFCNETLWPNFHYFNEYTQYLSKNWQTYRSVNQKYASEVLQLVRPDDTLWVHDYQLLLLPELLRRELPDASIGFFLHIPFPDLSSFARLPWRRELLKGMLGADVIGFHTYDDVRNFLFGVYRLLGIPHLNDTLRLAHRVLRVECMPMGIDYEKYESEARTKETEKNRLLIRASCPENKTHILSIDRLDYTKGIPQRLRAFETFLNRYPSYRNKVSMILIVVPSRESVPYYKKLKQEIDLLVGHINGKYANVDWQPIHYFYRSFPLSWLSAFYTTCEIALISPLIDGMNLVCKEFIASRKDTGVLILSETAGASKELFEASRVNPHDLEDIVQNIYKALLMSKKEQKRSLEHMQYILKKNSIQTWLSLFIKHLQESKQIQSQLKTQYLGKDTEAKLLEDFRSAKKRLIFLDYDGTLVDFSSQPNLAAPDQELLDLLQLLCSHPNNHIIIISGRNKTDMEQWLGALPLQLIAEHGAWSKNEHKWKPLENLNTHWKKDIRNILEEFVTRTPGSFIEEKHFSLAWHFRKVDPSFGELRAWSLINHLRYILSQMNLSIMEGNKVVEIKNPEVNKGQAAQKCIEAYRPDLVVAFGDDHTDEDTFRALPEQSYSIKVGAQPSIARYWIEEYNAVRQLLKKIAQID